MMYLLRARQIYVEHTYYCAHISQQQANVADKATNFAVMGPISVSGWYAGHCAQTNISPIEAYRWSECHYSIDYFGV